MQVSDNNDDNLVEILFISDLSNNGMQVSDNNDGNLLEILFFSDAVPHVKLARYPWYTVADRPKKADPYRTHITAEGGRHTYDGNVTAHTARIETIKLHWNSVVSTPRARYCTGYFSNVYLRSSLEDPKYVRFEWDLIPPRIIEAYQLEPLTHHGHEYAKIKKAWYGLKQMPAVLTLPEGHVICPGCGQLWDKIHKTGGCKSLGRMCLEEVPLQGGLGGQTIHRYMPQTGLCCKRGTLKASDTKVWTTSGGKIHPEGSQEVPTLWAINNTMLQALNGIASAKDTKATHEAPMYFLNYAANHPNGSIVYRASEMVLQMDSDATYLVSHGARSRAGGYHYLGDKGDKMINGPILVLVKIIKNVMASAAEAKPLKTENMTAQLTLIGFIKQKRSKAIDMRFYWLKDRAEQDSLMYFGNQENRIWQTIQQSLTCWDVTTVRYNLFTWMKSPYMNKKVRLNLSNQNKAKRKD
eukprot:jgi/Psemu1/23324/gm1.23324_g